MAILRRRDLASKFYPSHGLVERSLLTLFLADGKYIRNTPSQKYWDSVPEHIAASIPIQTSTAAFPIEGDKGIDIGKNFTGDFTSIINGYTGREYTVQLVTAVPYCELSSFKFCGIDFTRVGSSSSYKLTCNPLKPAGITVECGTKMVVTIIQHSNSTYDLNVQFTDGQEMESLSTPRSQKGNLSVDPHATAAGIFSKVYLFAHYRKVLIEREIKQNWEYYSQDFHFELPAFYKSTPLCLWKDGMFVRKTGNYVEGFSSTLDSLMGNPTDRVTNGWYNIEEARFYGSATAAKTFNTSGKVAEIAFKMPWAPETGETKLFTLGGIAYTLTADMKLKATNAPEIEIVDTTTNLNRLAYLCQVVGEIYLFYKDSWYHVASTSTYSTLTWRLEPGINFASVRAHNATEFAEEVMKINQQVDFLRFEKPQLYA